ncbi:peptide chain release factor N(5)-glutamine methyltransferase [Psychrobacter sp. FDAARGOS_221]|uniref:peptide chain release factor N(5)-glutamine methyltransferase n=1 Tax=Psychrobacter sp. FDAARGOS_221 TaxID=1975705 RepID=UPI000BB53109|nr:peptide chain release factor N(5)-glutamine methyltransferase [Psychrobacter sp. FDAARGOS_221]PNK61394.1 peptide chain release factor N(5)-glutamine methyltransferase [Psychrobacter sp. FDAARGOS_221]
MGSKHLAVNQIKRHNVDDLPAHWVSDWLLFVLQKPASFLISDGDYVLTDAEQAQFDAGIAKMRSGTPLAYLTGNQAFWSLQFEVNEYTLIPRPDTEVLVEQVLAWIDSCSALNAKSTVAINQSEPLLVKRLLDLGTGSGCIAISLAHELQSLASKKYDQWQITAIDYSQPALEVAQSNAALNKVNNIEFIQSDWFSALDAMEPPLSFEVIVSNPPYIVDNDEHLDKLKAEPLSALVAPDNGLADIKQIAEQARGYLTNGGLLAVEHGYDQGEAVTQIFTDFGYSEVRTIKDYGGNDRVTLGVYNN